jgi:site-specific DNA-methyltransferase (adenine-specific)
MRAWSVHCADWLDLARSLRPHSVDLLYVDPPFNTGSVRATPPGASRVRGRSVRTRYDDRWAHMGEYIAWLGTRLRATLPALKPAASILIHCDDRASHRIRVLLDDLLAPDCFVNHLIWHYGLGGSSPRRFARKHDDILFYRVDPRHYYFRPPMIPSTSRRMNGRLKKATDVIDIPSLNNMARERTGYPTQKPVALLSLLIEATCPPGGLVLDPTCGSGTTLVAAVLLARRAIGFDRNSDAVALTRARLQALGLDGGTPTPRTSSACARASDRTPSAVRAADLRTGVPLRHSGHASHRVARSLPR